MNLALAYILKARFFTNKLDSWFFHSVINNKVEDSDSPGGSEGVLHLPVGELLFCVVVRVHQPDGLTRLSTVVEEIGQLTDLQQSKD